MAGLTRVGLGFRAHSGWAAVVVVAGSPASPAVLDRRRIEIADRKTDGSVQPYHRAKELGVEKGERFLERCADVSRELARLALREIGSAHNVTGCGILLSSGRPAASLQATLASHAAIHTAEGEFFRKALVNASEQCGWPCRGVREKELFTIAAAEFGMSAEELQKRVNELGKKLGPPWTQDEKYASVAAWLAMK